MQHPDPAPPYNSPALLGYTDFKHLFPGRILEQFRVLLDTGLQAFMDSPPNDLCDNERAILVYLSHVYNESFDTVRVYCRNLCDFFNRQRKVFYSVSAWDVESYVQRLKHSGLEPATINNRINTVRGFYKYMNAAKILSADPTVLAKQVPASQDRHAEKVLRQDQLEYLFRYARSELSFRDYLILFTLYATGIRRSELVVLKWGDFFVDIQGRRQARIEGKGGKKRDVFFQEPLYRELLLFRSALFNVPPTGRSIGLNTLPVFPRTNNPTVPLSTSMVFRIVQSAGEKAIGTRISPHWLRHTFATQSRLAEAPLESIRENLGHVSYNTTLKYEHSPHLRDPAGAVLTRSFTWTGDDNG